MKRKSLIKIHILTLFILTIFVCGSCAKQNTNLFDEARSVRGTAAIVRELPDEAAGFGSLSFLSKVDIMSPQEAVIKRIYFREGDFVNQGEIVLLLENPQIELAVERAQNNYTQATAARNLSDSRLIEGIFQAEANLLALEKSEAELELAKRKWEEDRRKHQNQETLFEAGGIHTEAILVSRFNLDTEWEQILLMEREIEIRRIGIRDRDLVTAGIEVPLDENEKKDALVFLMTAGLRAEFEAAQARLEATEKELASANIALAELKVRSPASCIVGACYLEEGERVRTQDKILTLMDTASLYVIFPVREKEALRISNGMSTSVLIDGTGETRDAVVDLVYPQADSQTMSFLVRALLKETDDKLKPGMFARVTVTLGPPNKAIFIPESSIFNLKNSEGSVFIINGSALSERKVSLGDVYADEREIRSGLRTGEIVVIRPDPDLREGTNVTLVD